MFQLRNSHKKVNRINESTHRCLYWRSMNQCSEQCLHFIWINNSLENPVFGQIKCTWRKNDFRMHLSIQKAYSKAYSKLCVKHHTELFCGESYRPLTINYFLEKLSLKCVTRFWRDLWDWGLFCFVFIRLWVVYGLLKKTFCFKYYWLWQFPESPVCIWKGKHSIQRKSFSL